jgi:hypothetical protein
MGVRSLSTFIKENSSLKEGKTFTRIGEGQVSESEVLVVDAWRCGCLTILGVVDVFPELEA